MPNHLHAVIGFRNTGKSINTIVGNAKRFLAYGIVERLKNKNEEDILGRLMQGVKYTDKQRGKLHEVFGDSFDWKECISDDFHSSAAFYILGEENKYVTSFMKMQDIDLSK